MARNLGIFFSDKAIEKMANSDQYLISCLEQDLEKHHEAVSGLTVVAAYEPKKVLGVVYRIKGDMTMAQKKELYGKIFEMALTAPKNAVAVKARENELSRTYRLGYIEEGHRDNKEDQFEIVLSLQWEGATAEVR